MGDQEAPVSSVRSGITCSERNTSRPCIEVRPVNVTDTVTNPADGRHFYRPGGHKSPRGNKRPSEYNKPNGYDASEMDQNGDKTVTIGEFFRYADDGRAPNSFPVNFYFSKEKGCADHLGETNGDFLEIIDGGSLRHSEVDSRDFRMAHGRTTKA